MINPNTLDDNSRRRIRFFVTEGEIDTTKTYIRGSVADMQSLLVDVENNVPKEEEFFKKTEDERIRSRCNFRKVCH